MLSASIGKIFFNTIVSPIFLKQPGNEELIAEGHAELPRLFAYLEANIPPSQFLVGDTITLADVAVASPFVNYAHCGGSVDAATYPRLAAWLALIHALRLARTMEQSDIVLLGDSAAVVASRQANVEGHCLERFANTGSVFALCLGQIDRAVA